MSAEGPLTISSSIQRWPSKAAGAFEGSFDMDVVKGEAAFEAVPEDGPVEIAHHQWAIVSSGAVIAILRSNAAAWAWIDARDPEHGEMIERYYRIRDAFSPASR